MSVILMKFVNILRFLIKSNKTSVLPDDLIHFCMHFERNLLKIYHSQRKKKKKPIGLLSVVCGCYIPKFLHGHVFNLNFISILHYQCCIFFPRSVPTNYFQTLTCGISVSKHCFRTLKLEALAFPHINLGHQS